MLYELRSIDAWRTSGTWEWNAFYHLESDIFIDDDDTTNREILTMLRRSKFLSKESAGRISVNDDGYIIEIQLKGTKEPILAFVPQC